MSEEKYGFVYIWRDRKYNRYYIGCHWGTHDDGYVCSSNWMRKAYRRRPEDFRRKILKTNITVREQIYFEEQRWFDMIKPEEVKVRYYNLRIKNNSVLWHADPNTALTIGQKISAAKKGKSTGPCSPEKAKKISEAKLAKKRKMSEESKQKLREVKTGIPLSEEHRQKISSGLLKGEAKKSRERLSEEDLHATRMASQEKAIDALKGSKRYNNGVKEISAKQHPGEGWVLGRLPRNDSYSKSHSESTSKAIKGSTTWNDGVRNYRLKPGELPSDNWVRGMAKRSSLNSLNNI